MINQTGKALVFIGLFFAVILGAILFLNQKALKKIVNLPKDQKITQTTIPSSSLAPDIAPKNISSTNFAIHSFIFPGYSRETKKYLFDGAARTGKTLIRYDFSLSSIEREEGRFTFEKLEENVAMSKERGLEVVGVLGYSAPWIASRDGEKPFQGPIDPQKYDQFANYIKETVKHFPEVKYWEIWNEPNAKHLYANSPSEFAKMLKISYQAVKEVNPQAQVLFPGVLTNSEDWIKKVLTDPQNPGKENYDIANAHIRGSISIVSKKTKGVSDLFEKEGKKGAPLWVTEHGYPADPKFQSDPKYKGTDLGSGEKMQAEYYKESLPLMISSGADVVFVSLRDNGSDELNCGKSGGDNQFCSEGLVTFPTSKSTSGRDKPSMSVLQNAK